jgi:hypothetical protein
MVWAGWFQLDRAALPMADRRALRRPGARAHPNHYLATVRLRDTALDGASPLRSLVRPGRSAQRPFQSAPGDRSGYIATDVSAVAVRPPQPGPRAPESAICLVLGPTTTSPRTRRVLTGYTRRLRPGRWRDESLDFGAHVRIGLCRFGTRALVVRRGFDLVEVGSSASDFRDDLFGGLGPQEGLWVGVPVFGPCLHGVDESGDAGEPASA